MAQMDADTSQLRVSEALLHLSDCGGGHDFGARGVVPFVALFGGESLSRR